MTTEAISEFDYALPWWRTIVRESETSMNLSYSTDVGYGIRVKEHAAEEKRPAGYVVEIHFYDKHKAVEYAATIIRAASADQKAEMR